MNQELCRSLFDYRAGCLYWKVDRLKYKAGSRAGRQLRTGYRAVTVCGVHHHEHRLVFLWFHGFMPDQIDHINRVKNDNRVENLRVCDHSKNQMNTFYKGSESGIRGVRKVRRAGGKFRWKAATYMNGREIHIGIYGTAQEAGDAYRSKVLELFGEFARWNGQA